MKTRKTLVAALTAVALTATLVACSSDDSATDAATEAAVVAEETVVDGDGEEVVTEVAEEPTGPELKVPAGSYFIIPIPQQTLDSVDAEALAVEVSANNNLVGPVAEGETPAEGEIVSFPSEDAGITWKAGDTAGTSVIDYSYDPIGDGSGRVQAQMVVIIE